MKKIIRLNESEFVSLLKTTIMESYEHRLKYSLLSKEQKKSIEDAGFKILVNIKNFTKNTEEGVKDINHWLQKHGLIVKKPSNDFIVNNIKDIIFALDNLPLTKGKKFLLKSNLDLLRKQLEEPDENHVILFYEKDGEDFKWSLVNLYDNNILLWVRLINKRYVFPGKVNIDSLIDEYFGDCSVNTKAAKDIFSAMVNDREILSKEIFERTWGGGTEIEKSFVREILKLGVSPDNIKVFSGEGNFVDRSGIDLVFLHKNKWIPVQVKSLRDEARNAVPMEGIGVFPVGEDFYYFDGGDEPNKLENLLTK